MIQNVQIKGGTSLVRFICDRVTLNELGAYYLAPVQPGFTVGSIHVVGDSTWVNARVTPIVSNLDSSLGAYAAHPSGVALAPSVAPLSSVTPGLSLDYAYFGFLVTTAEGSAAVADIVIVMQP